MRAIYLCILSIIAISAAGAEGSYEFLGLQFPQLKTDRADWVNPSDTVFGASFPVDRDVRLFVSAKGGVDSMYYDKTIMPDFVRGVKNSLKALQFEPGKIKGKKAAVILPIRVTFGALGVHRRADLTLPYEASTGARDRRLINLALVENGFTLPGVEYFPSYYLSVPKDSGRTEYDYSVYKVSVDDDGKVTDFVERATSNAKLSDLFTISARYARYRAAGYKGAHFPSDFYLIARFFDKQNYPTIAWPADSTSSREVSIDRYRLENVQYLDSLLSPAYPENLSGVFGSPGMNIGADSIPAEIGITADGTIEWVIYGKHLTLAAKRDLDKILKQVRIIPAMDSTGRAVPFQGRLLISRAGSNKLRITADWLEAGKD